MRAKLKKELTHEKNTYSFYLNDIMVQQFEQIAYEEDCSVSYLLNKVMTKYVVDKYFGIKPCKCGGECESKSTGV